MGVSNRGPTPFPILYGYDMALIAQMVGRNEAQRFLIPVLTHLANIVDTVVFTDDCSDDGLTPIIAEICGANVYQVADRPLFVENEYELRSRAWKNLEKHAHRGDWILCIDCDEMLYGTAHLRELTDQSVYDVLGITFFHMWNETQYRIDKAWMPNRSYRLFRYYEGGEFQRKKLACGSEPTYVPDLIRRGKVLWDTGLCMKHLGYVRDEDKFAKYQRYMELDGGNFHARAHLESILDSAPTLVDWPSDNFEGV